MTDVTELRDNLDKALDAQRDALMDATSAAYEFGLKTGRDEQLKQDSEFWRLVLVRELGFTQEAASTTIESFKKAMRPATTQEYN